jgi:hypothetical protein
LLLDEGRDELDGVLLELDGALLEETPPDELMFPGELTPPPPSPLPGLLETSTWKSDIGTLAPLNVHLYVPMALRSMPGQVGLTVGFVLVPFRDINS